MLLPTIFGESLFDDFMDFDFPRFADIENIDKKLYGKKASKIMKTDVHEHDDHFEADIDLPDGVYEASITVESYSQCRKGTRQGRKRQERKAYPSGTLFRCNVKELLRR